MNKYVKSVEAALRATAPFVAIPVEGHAPACVRGKLLKGALKGVTIHSVKIITAPATPSCEFGRWLQIKGRADGGVHTSCKMVVENVKSYAVWKALSAWTDREREKRIKVISQGALNPAERRALKLKEAHAKEEQRRNAELIAAQREETDILDEARLSVFPPITPKDEDERAEIMAEYAEFRRCRSVRKCGSVIRWQLKKLREEKASLIKNQGRRNKVAVLRSQKNKLRYAALVYKIGQLETQLETLYPRLWRKWKYADGEDHGYWTDSFQEKRPDNQTYRVPYGWRDTCVPIEVQRDEDGKPYPTGLKLLAVRLRDARANILSLTPPEDEQENELPIAA